jgi:hypothetical protein
MWEHLPSFAAGFVVCGILVALILAYKSDEKDEAAALRSDLDYRRRYSRGWDDYGKAHKTHTQRP